MIDNNDDGKSGGKHKRCYLIANFNRAPLWFSDGCLVKRFWNWLIGGHFAPIISYVDDNNDNMHVLIADVNKDYGNYLIPVERLFNAIQCRESGGNCRGLLRVDVIY